MPRMNSGNKGVSKGNAPSPSRVPRRRRRIIGIAIVAIVTTALLLWIKPLKFIPPIGNKENELPSSDATAAQADVLADYGGSKSCKNCHRSEYDRWANSHHGFAERLVAPDQDRIAFDPPRTIVHATQASRVQINNGNYQFVTIGLSGKPELHTAMRVIGVDPLRQFLVDGGRGRMQAMELAYDPRRKEWFDVYGAEDRQPGEWGHWTGRGMTWNAMCATCHNTRLRKDYDENSDTYQTRMAEMSVGCEACHGPMKAHAQRREDPKNNGKPESSLAHFSRDQMTETCGSCHARRAELTGDFVPGQKFSDHYSLSGVDESELFYPDGQIHEEDYEYSAFLGSKMHAAGVRCMDCHDVHSGKTLFEGDALCMRCHVGAYPKAPVIIPALHTFHTAQSAGSRCVNCHMAQTQYMQRHNRHDHGFATPDPFLTKKIGVPNACNRCHADKDADWSVAAVDKWYDSKMDRPSRRRALIVAAARKHETWSKPLLTSLLSDAATTAYWRSAAIHLLEQWTDDASVRTDITGYLHDPDAMVRESAATALAPLAEQNADVARVMKETLGDSSRNVRIVAAHALERSLAPDSLATRDFFLFLDQQADQPTGQLALARYEIDRNRPDQAAVHLQRAVEFDPRSTAMRREVATLFARIKKPLDALKQIAEACRLEPGNAEYWLLDGLAANEAGQPAQALTAFERSVNLDPHNGRAWYNLGLARQQAEQTELALTAFDRAQADDPADADIPYAKAALLAQLHRTTEARVAAERVLKINPNYPQAVELLRALQAGSNN